MTSGDFPQVISKLRWAEQHIATLHHAIAYYAASKPYVSIVEQRPDAQAFQVRVQLRYPPPAQIGHLITDALSSLHGTLDYLAWQLALREGIGMPGRATTFPITVADKADAGSRVEILGRSFDGSRRAPVVRDPDVLAVLEQVQPHHLPADAREMHPLQLLRILNGESKHRHPAVIASAVDEGSYAYLTNRPFGVEVDATFVVRTMNRVVRDGDEIAWVWEQAVPDGGLPQYDDFPVTVSLQRAAVDPEGADPLAPLAVDELLLNIVDYIAERVLEPISKLDW